jgi:aromatic ring-opening dioxygenase LigB subunit
VGTATFIEDNKEVEIVVSPHLTLFNIDDAVILLQELSNKYKGTRKAKIDSVEKLKIEWQSL